MTKHSPAPFISEHSPFEDQHGNEIPSYRIFDANGDKVAETDSDKPDDMQSADATLLAASPVILAALEQAVEALNTAPRFRVPVLDTDSYVIASTCGRAIRSARGGYRLVGATIAPFVRPAGGVVVIDGTPFVPTQWFHCRAEAGSKAARPVRGGTGATRSAL
jgi:hypothetical protein